MIILGIDHGEKKIGLAISDETELIAAPLPTLKVRNEDDAIKKIKKVMLELRVEEIVLGVPSGWQGKDSPQTVQVKSFKDILEIETNTQVHTWDETYSTKQAEKGARKRKRRNSDSEAARIILQGFLDFKRGE